jgi:Na+-driven multidrug efflux pump
VANLFNIVFIQLGSCLAIVVGQHLGAGEIKKAKDSTNKIMVFSVLCCLVIGTIMIIGGRYFPRLYNIENEIKELATSFIVVAALVMPVCAYAHCAYFVLRSGGKTFITFLFDSAFTWIVVIPCAFILAKYTTLGITMVYFIVQFTEIIKAIIGYFMVKSGIWIKNIVSEA